MPEASKAPGTKASNTRPVLSFRIAPPIHRPFSVSSLPPSLINPSSDTPSPLGRLFTFQLTWAPILSFPLSLTAPSISSFERSLLFGFAGRYLFATTRDHLVLSTLSLWTLSPLATRLQSIEERSAARSLSSIHRVAGYTSLIQAPNSTRDATRAAPRL
jgi:hypothetical protein